MKFKKIIGLVLPAVMAFSSFPVCHAAFETQVNDVRAICDVAVEYVNSGSKDDFKEYMSNGIKENVTFESGKFEYLYGEDSEFADNKNQLTKTVAIIGDIYVNGGDSKITQSDINKNVTPGYGDEGLGDDYEDDDAEKFMEVISENKSKLTNTKSSSDKKTQKAEEKNVLPEKNSAKKESSDETSSSSGTSVGGVILASLIVSIIVFAAGTYALQQVSVKNKEKAVKNIDGDDIFNLRLAVKSMQSSIQKADGNFKELDKLRIQVDEIDEKLEHISDYLRKLNKSE